MDSLFNAPTKIIIRYEISESKRSILHNIFSTVKLPEFGVVIIIDAENYDENNYPIWGALGLHLNIKDGGFEDLSPPFIYTIMNSLNFSNIIWISNKVALSNDEEFAWIVLHELGHLRQDIISYSISRAGNFLYHTLGNIKKGAITLDVPYELDAELYAWRMSREMMGSNLIDEYVMRKSYDSEGFKKLIQFGYDYNYDVISETIEVLNRYESELKQFQIEYFDNEIIKNFDFDNEREKLISLLNERTIK